MKAVIKHIVAHTYKPLLVKYLSKTRQYRYGDIRLEIPPQVFHPGFFFSTQLLLQYITGLSLAGKRFLELGAGSGLISIHAAKNGATVTASDINTEAITQLKKNSIANNTALVIFHADLFTGIPEQVFDIIAINPPYYKKQPHTPIDHAWYCGENGEYFTGLFEQLPNYINDKSEVIMVCCDGCDMAMIRKIAADNGFELRTMLAKQNLLEKNFIFKIERTT
ncbi:MAG TPA: methyltransferase [Chitinophagaceae bacterium]